MNEMSGGIELGQSRGHLLQTLNRSTYIVLVYVRCEHKKIIFHPGILSESVGIVLLAMGGCQEILVDVPIQRIMTSHDFYQSNPIPRPL